MDCNNYSYAPTMLENNNIIKEYRSDDMRIRIETQQNSLFVWAYSYDGELDVFERFNRLENALSLFYHIGENYSVTPPDMRILKATIRRIE